MRPSFFFIPAALAVTVLVLGFATLGLYLYDSGRDDVIAKGVSIGAVDVGGMKADEARTKLRTELLGPLQEPLVVRSGDDRFPLSAKEAKIRADIDSMITQALDRSREGSFVGRGLRGISGVGLDEHLTPTVSYDRPAVQRLVDKVRVQMSRKAQDATVKFMGTGVAVRRSRSGRTIDAKALRAQIQERIVDRSRGRMVRAKLITSQPKITTEQVAKQFPVVLTVNRLKHRIHLYKNLKQQLSYPIALGQAGLDTPSGEYKIQNKAVNPTWHVPNSAWAGDLAGTVVPGGVPSNPLKSRWMGIQDGVGVHGTADRASIGTNASHGCIRMLVEDVEELYDHVPVGTPIFIA